MRVLYITQGFPAESMVGGQISSYFRVVQLVRAGHEVTALCLVPKDGALTDAREIERLCAVEPVYAVPGTTPFRLALGLFDRLPWPIRRYSSRAAARKATELAVSLAPELVVFNSLHSATLLPAVRSVTDAPCLLFCPNVQSTIMTLFAEHQQTLPARLYARDQALKMHRYEGSRVGGFDAVCAYSRVDAAGLASLASDTRIDVIPIALDPDAMGSPTEPEFDLLITGNFAWPPNADSLAWYLDEIHPHVLEESPDATVRVVGPGSESWRGRVVPRGVTFVGRVDDIAPFFRTARALAVPLRIGSGIRVKIIQAFGARLPVVSTSKGCEGIEIENGRHLLTADRPDEFAASVARLIRDGDLRRALAREGRTLAEREHDALAPGRPFVAACERLAERSGR